ncbi:uncharacterized protein LOC108028683 isoform X2 [Drosophila biarmipes]|uniref:uncharacterized protein LOC108028683 isoform X2 n=1 Tax=Drosophila biarmipes TaxID=125945 RepID=UPI0021CC90DE|nr:uncharacterized protein LOC108028683 isoform X2 [Drosophila biarmipes]
MVKMVKGAAVNKETVSLISESEMLERQKNYTIRLHDIAAACSSFKNALAQLKELQEERTYQDRWDQFTRCDGLPKVRSPVEIRTFLAKIRHFEEIEINDSIDWTLGVDERSILTQNIFHKDLTRATLQKTSSDNPGTYFETNLKNCLEVLRQVDVLMDNEVEMERMSLKVQIDLMEVYKDVQREIESLFDRLTYRILRMQKVYMESVNGIVAKWSHSCDSWRMDLWGLYNVPIIFQQLEVPLMIAEFKASEVTIQLPLSVLGDCVTLRCVHTSFDHRSEDAKSFEPPTVDVSVVPISGITEMEESVVGEWLMQHDIQEETLDSMNKKREEYEELMQLIAERTEQAAKEAKFGKAADGAKRPKIVIPKTPKLVPLVPQGMFPEVYTEFLHREDNQYKTFLDSYFHPRLLNLSLEEINLRQSIIIGGVYNITFVRRPEQTQFEKFNIILHEDGRVLHVIADVVARVEGNFRSSHVSDFTRMTFATSQFRLDDNELPFFVVTVKLPPDLCRWGTPEVCHYLREVEAPPRTPDRSTLVTLNIVEPQRISSQLTQREESAIRSTLGNQFYPTLRSILKQSISHGYNLEKGTSIQDFHLNKTLTKLEIMKLSKICLPRIISSFKLPSEFTEDSQTSEAQKTRPNRLLKRTETELAVETKLAPTEDFDYAMQQQPERMFPVFEKTVPVEFIPADHSISIDPNDTSTACGLVSTLETIRGKYLHKPLQLLEQVEVVSKKSEKRAEVKNVEVVKSVSSLKDKMSNANVSDRKSLTDAIERKSVLEDVGRASVHKGARRNGSVIKRRSMRKSAKVEDTTKFRYEERDPPVLLDHWTKEHIIESTIDHQAHTLTFRTTRLGIFGLAFKRYEHFPFRDWCLQPNENNPDEIILSLDTFHVRMFFYITSQGVRGYVTDLTKGYTAKPVKYLEIVEPISDFRVLLTRGKELKYFRRERCQLLHHKWLLLRQACGH